MGEKMKRTRIWLTLGTFAAIFSLATAACSSGGGDEDDDDDGGSSGNGTGGTATAGNGTGGTGTAAGTSAGGTSTAAGTGTTAGTGATAGTGTGGTGGGSAGPSVCDNSTFELPVGEAYVDNFEEDTRFLGWYSFSDTTPPNMPAPDRASTGALTTMYSGHVGATGIKSSKMMGYGAGFGFGLVDPAKGACVDLSAFKGISFWIKGTAGADNTLKFQIVSPSTQPADSMPVGDCPTSASACAFKHPSKTVTLTADWKQVIINFSDLAPAAAYTGKVLGFNMITDGPAYDVNIDEVT
ncbi:MAG: hypothetical protein K0R38_2223, partial [Polyangiaceae bacterium]|nr:hypothetical protein [Polyangiaceae bacterium]